jgi:long-chain acyl-CoA synthetase
VGTLFDKIPHGKVEKDSNVYNFKSLLKHPPQKRFDVQVDPMKDLAYILYTGGTTGFPKGVPGNHLGMTSYVRDIMEDVVAGAIEEGKDTYIAVNPLFHIMALGFFVATGLNFGNTTILMPVPQTDAIMLSIQKYKVRWFLGVPALYRMILENDRLDQYDLKTLRYCFCGGDVLPIEVFKRWKEFLGISIYQVYGSTEAGHVTYSLLNRDRILCPSALP